MWISRRMVCTSCTARSISDFISSITSCRPSFCCWRFRNSLEERISSWFAKFWCGNDWFSVTDRISSLAFKPALLYRSCLLLRECLNPEKLYLGLNGLDIAMILLPSGDGSPMSSLNSFSGTLGSISRSAGRSFGFPGILLLLFDSPWSKWLSRSFLSFSKKICLLLSISVWF